MPSKAPEAKASKEKPDGATYCPASGKKLKLKDLVEVKFTPVPEGGCRVMVPERWYGWCFDAVIVAF